MGTLADAVFFVLGMHVKVERAVVHARQFRMRPDPHADRRSRHMCHIKMNANRLMTCRQQAFDRLQRRRLHQIDHDGCRQHAHATAADVRRGVFLTNHDLHRTFKSGLNL